MGSTKKYDVFNYNNINLHHAKENTFFLTPEEMFCRDPKLPYQKTKFLINDRSLTSKEIIIMRNYGVGNNTHTH